MVREGAGGVERGLEVRDQGACEELKFSELKEQVGEGEGLRCDWRRRPRSHAMPCKTGWGVWTL